MLVELAVRDLGVIAELRLLLGPGMTAVTGETGAGKTMVVDAIELLVGGRSDPALVRTGADEAWVEGRFLDGDREVVVARAIPRNGRSRAYVDGRLATAQVMAELGVELVDLHGQHAHQSLLAQAAQRDALDTFAGVDLGPLTQARRKVASLVGELGRMGGDERERARELDLVRYQVSEIEAAGITGPDEDEELGTEEDLLADATAHREAAAMALEALSGEGAASDALGTAVSALSGRSPFAAHEERLRAVAAELTDATAELRLAAEEVEEDPERLAVVRERRQLLHDLRRKYGDTLAEVVVEGERLSQRLAERVREHLAELAMRNARVEVQVSDDDPGDDVEILLAANPGTPALPLAKVASGGELARIMLALRLVLTSAPPTLVFDEVDAGIGGPAAEAVGRALARLAGEHQVFVVTHLPQVAAYADAQVRVAKRSDEASTVSSATVLDDGERVIELSRMLSGQPSAAAREHAIEMLTTAAGEKGR